MKIPKLVQLAMDNIANAKPLKVECKADNSEATVYVYDMIDDYYGVSAQSFIDAINGITASVINVRVNSPGGDVFAARAMVTAIAAHSSKIVAHIDGLAASAASYLAMAADEVVMSEGSFLMIHKAWSGVLGNSDDMRTTADLLDKIDASIVADYQRKTGLPADEISQMMAAETWMDATEAVEKGFADSVATNGKGAKASAQWNLSAYANAPKIETPSEPEICDSIAAQLQANHNRMRLFKI